MTSIARYRLNSPTVIAEVIEGEAIIVNLDSGAYYSLQGSGAEAWQLATQGSSLDEMVAAFSKQYDAQPDTIAEALRTLIGDLKREQLIAIAPTDAEPTNAASSLPPATARIPFQPPALQIYTDMADLLLLDPIHEVEETGWPNAKAETKAAKTR